MIRLLLARIPEPDRTTAEILPIAPLDELQPGRQAAGLKAHSMVVRRCRQGIRPPVVS